MNTAIIVAAGSGTRFKSETPKQFLEIHGKPIVVHTLERFEHCPAVDEIILVLSESEINNFKSIPEKFKFGKIAKIVAGGKTRAESVANGLAAVSPDTEIAAVHDGVRPLVSSEEIRKTIEAAKIHGAACLVANLTDTIKEISGGRIVLTLDRANLRRALTPQAFKIDILQKALAQSNPDEAVTDECYLVEKLGYEIAIVEGGPRNIKITHPEDFIFAETILKSLKI